MIHTIFKVLSALMVIGLALASTNASSIEKGNALFFQGRYTDALGHYMQAYSDQSDQDKLPYALYLSAKCYLIMGNHDMALRNLWRLVSDYPESQWAVNAYLLLGRIREREDWGRLPEALVLFETIPSRYSRSHKLPEAFLGAARVKIGLNYHAFAHADMKKTIEQLGTFEETAQIHYDIATVYAHPQNPDRDVKKALEHFAIVLQRYPASDYAPLARLYKARLNWESGNRTKALEHFRQIVLTQSGKPVAEYAQESIARIHEERGDLQRAVNALRTLLVSYSYTDLSRRRIQSEIDRFTGVIEADDKPAISAWIVDEKAGHNRFEYKGDVKILIHGGSISADQAIVDYSARRITADGNIRIAWGDQYLIYCDAIIYDVQKRQAHCKGNVKVKHRVSEGIEEKVFKSVSFSFKEGELKTESD